MEYLEDTRYFDEYGLPDVLPPDDGKHFSYYEGDESVVEGKYKSNNYSSHKVHVDIP